MKNFVLLILFVSSLNPLFAQQAESLTIHDTRDVNDQPNFVNKTLRADFKFRNTISAPGTGNYSTNITIAPWNNNSGNFHHQLNFNNGGIYYRTGLPQSTNWDEWKKLMVVDADGSINGTLDVNGKLTTIGDVIVRSEQVPAPMEVWGGRLIFGQGWENGDPIYFSRVNIKSGHSELRLNLGDDGSEKLTLGFNYFEDNLWRERIVFRANGFVGIKVSDPTCELDVNGRIKGNTLDINELIRAKEVKIQIPDWSDFVFSPDYKLPTLSEVESHIKEKQHLPDIPSEKEVKENGIDIGEMQAKLLQKIEELTLYVIDLKKENEMQNKLIKELQNEKTNR